MRVLIGIALCAACIGAPPEKSKFPGAAPVPFNVPLWEDGKVPGSKGDGPLDKPFITAFLPSPEKANGSAVVIAPGGSNIMLMYAMEGMEVAERFNDWGMAAFVLTYRLEPRYDGEARVQDGKRAIQVVRAHAAEWKLDPKRVGYIGFSAGANMGRPVVAASGPGEDGSADPVARLSSRPDFLALVYGPGRATPNEKLSDFPPTFLCVAQNDRGPALGSAQLFVDLTNAGVPTELHIYQKGRHGFGSGFNDPEFSGWMPALQTFLVQSKMIPPSGGKL
ncbi:MAG TPA: alpha/beta hydrolase [Bryobacteraceae bacterium]|nr:alpha/beta hydrolase [Bryobacteraceae bacterium]